MEVLLARPLLAGYFHVGLWEQISIITSGLAWRRGKHGRLDFFSVLLFSTLETIRRLLVEG
jgi:hypothetical protein